MKENKEKGITLVALVVTIIVLLILAGIAINLTVGNNGIFTRASATVIVHENSNVYEQLCLKIADYTIGEVSGETTLSILEKLKNEGYVNEDNSVNVNLLTKTNMKTGKGSIGKGDVYVIETNKTSELAIARAGDDPSGMAVSENLTYYLFYYDKENNFKNLGKLFGNDNSILDELNKSNQEML